jgi:hypothetical protein
MIAKRRRNLIAALRRVRVEIARFGEGREMKRDSPLDRHSGRFAVRAPLSASEAIEQTEVNADGP